MGQSPQNCTVRQCVIWELDISKFSIFINIGFNTFKKYDISLKKKTGPPPRPLCFIWPVIQIFEDVTH